MWKYAPFTFKNLWRNRRRTILTVFSVSLSLFLLGLLYSVYAAFYHQEPSADGARRLITRHRVSLTQLLPAFYGDRIRALEGVEAVCAEMWFGGTYIDDRPEHMFARFAVEPDQVFKIYPDFPVPPDQEKAFLEDRQGFAVGRPVADRLGFKLGDRVVIKGDIFPIDLELNVRAIFDGKNADATFFHREYLNEGMPEGMRDIVGFYVIRATSADAVPRVAQAIDEMFRNAQQPTKTETEAAFQLAFINQLGNIKLFLLSIAGAVVFTVVLVSANTMAMSIRERVREIGVLRTLGFSSGLILAMILAEALAMALLGGVVGAGGVFVLLSSMQGTMLGPFPMFPFEPMTVPVCLGTALFVGFFSALWPAFSASRTKIIEALRHVG